MGRKSRPLQRVPPIDQSAPTKFVHRREYLKALGAGLALLAALDRDPEQVLASVQEIPPTGGSWSSSKRMAVLSAGSRLPRDAASTAGQCASWIMVKPRWRTCHARTMNWKEPAGFCDPLRLFRGLRGLPGEPDRTPAPAPACRPGQVSRGAAHSGCLLAARAEALGFRHQRAVLLQDLESRWEAAVNQANL